MSGHTSYTEENIRSLDWKEHIRMRPGMYIGKLGDGSAPDDGIYILIKEVIDNSIDEFVMGSGKTIELSVRNQQVIVPVQMVLIQVKSILLNSSQTNKSITITKKELLI